MDIAWDRESSCTSDSDEELEHWQNRLHEVSTLRCNMMTKSLRCVSSEVRNLPYYDGLTDVDKFLDAFEREVPEKHRFQAWIWHCALRLQDGGVRTKTVLMDGVITEE
jgi:hypothetical protein